MRILITRSSGIDARLKARLDASGHQAIAAPMLRIVACDDGPIPCDGVQAVLVTSVNGAQYGLPRLEASALRDLPVFCVGDRTAAVARDAGARQVTSARGDAAALVALVVRSCDAAAGDLLHLCGDMVAPALVRDLTSADFGYSPQRVYEARPAAELPGAVVHAIAGGDIDRVLLYSPRGARRFRELLTKTLGADAPAGLHAVALSLAVAEAAGPGYASMTIAAAPNETALLAAAGPRSGNEEYRG